MPNAFVDTNILIYAADDSEPMPRNTAIAREVLRQRDLWLSVQVLNEFTVNARHPKKLGLGPQRLTDWLERFLLFSITPTSIGTFQTALAVHARYGISHWDSLIVASALETDCQTLYSEDLNHGQNYNGTKVINPFL